MATCPAGHESAATDFCDVCGMRMAASASADQSALTADPSPPAASITAPGNAAGQAAASPPAGAAEHCPSCGADRAGQLCETCGHDFSTGPPATAEPAAFS